jgi:hypothetical protein
VDNFVDKDRLTPGNAIFHAGFNKLPTRAAKIRAFKINHLRMPKYVKQIFIVKIVIAFRVLCG